MLGFGVAAYVSNDLWHIIRMVWAGELVIRHLISVGLIMLRAKSGQEL